MIGFVAEKIPLSGALGMSIVGGMGMFSTSIFQPIIGSWIDSARIEQQSLGLTGGCIGTCCWSINPYFNDRLSRYFNFTLFYFILLAKKK